VGAIGFIVDFAYRLGGQFIGARAVQALALDAIGAQREKNFLARAVQADRQVRHGSALLFLPWDGLQDIIAAANYNAVRRAQMPDRLTIAGETARAMFIRDKRL
jgi:hypothetical protein